MIYTANISIRLHYAKSAARKKLFFRRLALLRRKSGGLRPKVPKIPNTQTMDIRETLESTMTEGEKIAALSEKLLENQSSV